MRGIWQAFALALAATVPSAAHAARPAPSAWDQDRVLGRGISILGNDPIWKSFRQGRFKTDHFQKIRAAGFTNVRIVVQSSDAMDKNNRLSDQWLATLDWAISGANKAGLNVIVDAHDGKACNDMAAACPDMVIRFWKQAAHHLRKRGDNVMFELLDAPHGALDGARWNSLIQALVPIVRADNPNRTLVIGPAEGNSFAQLDTLLLPEKDRHIIVTFHYGIAPGAACCTAAERARIDGDFASVAAWSKAQDRPILLGAFGTGQNGDTASGIAWSRAVARSAERHDFAWTYWQFDGESAAYDMKTDAWVSPILGALIPGKE
jgi:endoglucanase